MPAVPTREKSAWEDKFQTPTLADLIEPYDKTASALFELARERLGSFEGVSESLIWHGVPWRWCYAYSCKASDAPLAHLIPVPQRPMVGISLTAEVITELPTRRLSRTVREGIVHAPTVNGLVWSQWELLGKGTLEELRTIVSVKHKLLHAEG